MYPIIHLLPLFDDWALLALRLAAGVILIAHGWMKFKNLPATIEWFPASSFSPGWLWIRCAMVFEILGGVGIIAGYLTQFFAALFTLGFMIIVVWQFYRRVPFVGGYELDLLLLATMLVMVSVGGGHFTISQIVFGGY